MIVEDNREIRELFKKILIEEGYEIIECEDGKKALATYKKLDRKPEILVIDYKMPQCNGLELTEEILSKDPNSRILMISGDPRVNEEIIKPYNIRFKSKPISKKELLSEVKLMRKKVLEPGFQETNYYISGDEGIDRIHSKFLELHALYFVRTID